MLVCSISLRAPRRAIAAELVEIAAALDASTTGQVVFATLVDDPASVNDRVDAYLGEIMLEAASADAVADAGLSLTGEILETVSAADTQDGSATAASSTWDPATVASVTLSGGNLVATNTGTTAANQGARVPSASGKTNGKYYFEITVTTKTAGGNVGFGVATTASTYTGMGNNATAGACVFYNGNVFANSANTGWNISLISAGAVIGVAVDLDNRKAWFRQAPSGNWNGQAIGSQNPATNTGGGTVPAGTITPICMFGGTLGVAGNVLTANFGATAFTGTAPSGFASGW